MRVGSMLRKDVTAVFGNKMVKMILSIILVLIYCLAVREEAKAFLLTFISFYLLYLIYETWFFFSFEVNLKRKKKNKNKNETVA